MQYLLVRTWFTAVRARAFLKLRTRCVERAALSQTSHRVPFSFSEDAGDEVGDGRCSGVRPRAHPVTRTHSHIHTRTHIYSHTHTHARPRSTHTRTRARTPGPPGHTHLSCPLFIYKDTLDPYNGWLLIELRSK